MCSWDGEAYQVYSEVTRKARVAHRCYECHLPIPVGVIYVHSSGYLDGWHSFDRHVECVILSRIVEVEYCGNEGMWIFGSLLEEISEYEKIYGGEVYMAEDEPLHGPGHLHGALAAIRARYAPASASA